MEKTLFTIGYNVLVIRGMRGTFVYCENKAFNDYLKSLSENGKNS